MGKTRSMSDNPQGPGWWQASDGRWYPPQQAPGFTPATPWAQPAVGPLGRPEKIGVQILLAIVTFGLYGIYWAYKCHDEINNHTGEGVGGGVGALIYFLAGIVTLFMLPMEIQKMYERDGRESPVSATTAFWILLFGIPWYVKCQSALNDYWISKGAPPPS